MILLPVALWLAALPALAQTDPILITWNSSTTNGPHTGNLAGVVTANGPGLTQNALRRNVIIFQEQTNGYNSINWATSPTTTDLTRYLEWGFDTDRPYLLDHLRIRLRRSGRGPESIRIDMQRDSSSSVPVLTGTLPSQNNAIWFNTALADQTVNSQVRFRLYGWNAVGSVGNLRVLNEDLQVENHGIVIHGRLAVAELEAIKSVMVFSEDGSGCDDLTAGPPATPAKPAAIPGGCIQYTISVQNTGPVAAQNITLVDELPAPLNFKQAALGADWGTGSTQSTPNCPGPGCEVRVESGVIAAGGTATITIRATID